LNHGAHGENGGQETEDEAPATESRRVGLAPPLPLKGHGIRFVPKGREDRKFLRTLRRRKRQGPAVLPEATTRHQGVHPPRGRSGTIGILLSIRRGIRSLSLPPTAERTT